MMLPIRQRVGCHIRCVVRQAITGCQSRSAEEIPAMPEIALPALEAVIALNPCQAAPPDPVVTTVAPVPAHQPLYLSAGDCLYALNAADGTARWCQQVKLTRTREVIYPPEVSVPPPHRMHFAAPRAVGGDIDVDGQVYVCIDRNGL
jgi:hypothetical protein